MSNKYNVKMNIPQYEPKSTPPLLTDCYDMSKCNELYAHINLANITAEEKKFLKWATTRHIKFNYSKIADYYASASPDMQELMEESALVIIDFNDAIANGYVKLSKRIENIVENRLQNE